MFSDISEGCKLLDFHFLGLGSKFSETSKSLFFKRQLSVNLWGEQWVHETSLRTTGPALLRDSGL